MIDVDKIEEVIKSIEVDEILKLTQELIRRQSHVNCDQKEREVAHFLEGYLEDFGCSVKLQEVAKDRPNVIAILPGNAGGRSLMFNGHLDTIPPAGMEDPFNPKVVGKKLFGRGSADMKGAIAAMAVAMKAIASHKIELKGDLIFTGTVGEEMGSPGMDYLIKHNDHKPAFCVVGEPTSLNIGLAHKGIEWIKIETKGKPAHGSTPQEGISAITHMACVIRILEEELIPRLKEKKHPLLGSPTLNIGTIKGGDKPNIVPESCFIQVDRRWVPGESIDSILDEIQAGLDKVSNEVPDLAVSFTRMKELADVYHGPFEISEGHELVNIVREAVKKWSKDEPELVGLDYWTDGALAKRAGIPTVIFGPGAAAQAHTKDEFVKTNFLAKSGRAYCQIALDICYY